MNGKPQQVTEPLVNAVGGSKSQLFRWARETTRSTADLRD